MIQATRTRSSIQDYYGTVLRSTDDLRTGACCSPARFPEHLRTLLDRIHPEVRERFYGCGVPIPSALEGATVLDLGCGTGRDCYLLSQLVGDNGRVIGVDMTEEQLRVAERHRGWHAERFGQADPNVDFRQGYIEELGAIGIGDESIDVVVSNCVFNLSPDKSALYREIFRVLKPGGELYFSDVFADRRLPAEAAEDPVLLGECLGGAMYVEDFRRLVSGLGCPDVREVSRTPVDLLDPEIEVRLGMATFTSRTFRVFKVALEDRCEDFGQVATYRGTIDGAPHRFELDPAHLFETGRPERVCGNTAEMLSRTRYAPHFDVYGDRSVHFGLFDCGPVGGVAGRGSTDTDGAACC